MSWHMSDEPLPSERVDQLVEDLRGRVEQRRRDGYYPPGLEKDLDGHFQRIVAHRAEPPVDTGRLRDLLHDLDGRLAFSAAKISAESESAVGSAVHRSVGKLVSRQTEGVLQQVRQFGDGVRVLLREIVDALDEPAAHVHADLLGVVDGVLERLAAYERAPAGSAAAVGNLRSRVEALEVAEARRQFNPWFSNDRFEAEFRGTRDELKTRYHGLVELLGSSSPVLDIGCGRGELLELCAEMGIEASGVEVDESLVNACVASGFDVTLGDGVQVLASYPEEGLGGITMMQVVEHLSAQQVVDILALAAEKLRPGGKMLVETVNPQSLYVYAHAFYLDPTHVQPVHPAYLTFLFREAGFAEVTIDWRSTPVEEERLEESPEVASVVNANTRRLNQLLFAPQDYAVIATR